MLVAWLIMMVKTTTGIIFIAGFTLLTSACKSKRESHSTVTVPMDTLVCGPSPFLPVMRTVELVKDTAIGIGNSPAGPAFLFKIITQENISYDDDARDSCVVYAIWTTQGNRNVYVFDTNGDRSFAGESIDSGEADIKISHIKFVMGGDTCFRAIVLRKVVSMLQVSHTSHKKFPVGISALPVYRYGTFTTTAGKVYRLAMFNQLFTEYTAANSVLVVVPEEDSLPPASSLPIQYKVGDTLMLNEGAYRFDSVSRSGSIIHFEVVKRNTAHFGIVENAYAHPMQIIDSRSGNSQALFGRAKFTVIDFWGTWCPPCIRLTPKLQQMQRQYGEAELQIVGVACDNSRDKVARYLESNNIHWSNVLESPDSGVISSRFKVKDFPTFILLAKDGRIIKRGVGEESLVEIDSWLRSK